MRVSNADSHVSAAVPDIRTPPRRARLRGKLAVSVSAVLLSTVVLYSVYEPDSRAHWLIAGSVVALVVVALIGQYLRNRLIRPALELHDATMAVRRHGDYGIRVPVRASDELGRLADSFNAMLETIEARDRSLSERAHALEMQIGERTAALEQAQASLLAQERLATLGKLTGTVSHELRNPLGTIQTSIDVLRGELGQAEPKVERALQRIERNIHRCESIINELLDYSRGSPPNVQRVQVDSWLRDILAGYPHPLRIECENVLPIVAEFDPERLRRAVINVLDNAWQACVEHPTAAAAAPCVRVAVRAGASRIEIDIADNGAGMSPDVLGRVFEPLFSTRAFGIGLGLAIVRQILQQHGGGVELGSVPGRGTRVCLWLPWRQGHGSEAA